MTCFRCSIWKRTPLLSKCRPIPDDKNASTPENTRGGKIFRATLKQSCHCKIANILITESLQCQRNNHLLNYGNCVYGFCFGFFGDLFEDIVHVYLRTVMSVIQPQFNRYFMNLPSICFSTVVNDKIHP